MLTALSISQFAIAEKLALDLQAGMTVITGETGAGKSISLDALSLALGARADSNIVRVGSDKTDIRAVFEISALPHIKAWLQENELATNEDECILRRTISAEGRSKAYINDQPVNLNTLKILGDLLVDIHSQHAHHQLLRKEHHQILLDAYAHCSDEVRQVTTLYQQWQHSLKQIEHLRSQQADAEQRQQFLAFQLDEFSQLNLKEDEFQQLENRHALASRSDALKSACQQTLLACREHERHAVLDQLLQCQHSLQEFTAHSTVIKEACDLLDSAHIQIDEACQSLRSHLREMSHQQDDLVSLERRLSEILQLARKNRVLPEQLPELQQRLQNELAQLTNSDEAIHALEQKASSEYQHYKKQAEKLSQLRKKACKSLEEQIHQQLSLLGMGHCRFEVMLNSDASNPRPQGFESAEFLIATNPAAPAQALQKIASGGELSRISLAIQVVTAKSSTIPTLIFDEVDVGIGGATAEVVGRLLQQLSQSAQIICVTHQAQVASFADQHLFVSKSLKQGAMNTHVSVLDQEGKINEVARMLGGVEITKATLDHAADMLQRAKGYTT